MPGGLERCTPRVLAAISVVATLLGGCADERGFPLRNDGLLNGLPVVSIHSPEVVTRTQEVASAHLQQAGASRARRRAVQPAVRAVVEGVFAADYDAYDQYVSEIGLAPGASATSWVEAIETAGLMEAQRPGASLKERLENCWTQRKQRGCDWERIDLASIRAGSGLVATVGGDFPGNRLVGQISLFEPPEGPLKRAEGELLDADPTRSLWLLFRVFDSRGVPSYVRVNMYWSDAQGAWIPISIAAVGGDGSRAQLPML